MKSFRSMFTLEHKLLYLPVKSAKVSFLTSLKNRKGQGWGWGKLNSVRIIFKISSQFVL